MRSFPSDSDWASSRNGWDDWLFGFLTFGGYNIVKSMVDHYYKGKNEHNVVDTKETETIPNVKGSKNQPLSNKVYPLCAGKTLFAPYYFAPYTLPYGTDGENQKYYCCYLLGYNKVSVSKIKMGAIDLVTGNTVQNGKIVPNEQYNSLYKNNIKFYLEQNDVNNTTVRNNVLNVDGDTNFVATNKVNQQDFGIELLKVEGKTALNVQKFTDYNPMKVEVEIFFNSLFKYNDKGEVNETTVGVKVEGSLNGGTTWFNIPFSSQSSSDTGSRCKVELESGVAKFTAKKNKNMRFVATKNLSYSDCFDNKGNNLLTNKVMEIRVTRTTDQSTDTKVNDKVYLASIRTYCFDEEKSKTQKTLVAEKIQDDIRWSNSSRLSMVIDLAKYGDTGDQNITIDSFDVDEISCVIEPMCRTWNGSAWSSGYSATSNPASVALMMIQHSMLGKKALSGSRENKIDLTRYGQLYEVCEAHQSYKTINGDRTLVNTPYRCSGIFTTKKKLADYVNAILDTARSIMVMNGTKYSVNIDCARETPVHILNNHNILADGRSNTKNFDERIDGLKIKFRNENNDYQQDELKVYYDGVNASNPDLILESVTLDYITNPDLVWSYGRYLLAKRILRPESYNLKVGVDGKIIEIGSLVEIQDDTISVGIGDGGFITKIKKTGNYITSFETDSELYIDDPTKDYAFKVVHSDGINEPVVKVIQIKTSNLEAGYYKSFELKNSIASGLSIDDGCSFGYLGSETLQVICTNKTDNGDGTYALTFVPYSPDVFNADKSDIPVFDTKLTNITQNVGKAPASNEYVSKSDVARYVRSVASLATYYAVTDNTTMPDPTMIPSENPSPLSVNEWTTDKSAVYGNNGLYSQQHPYVWTGLLKLYSDGTKDLTLDSITMSHWGDKGDAGNDYVLDLTQEVFNLFANSDGTCSSESFSTQVMLIKDTEYVPLESLTITQDGEDVTNSCTITPLEDGSYVKNVTIPTNLLTKDTSDFMFTAIVTVERITKVRYAKLSVSKFYGIKILDFQLDYNSVKVDNSGEITPKVITPSKYYQTSTGQFMTNDGYMMIQELPNGEPKPCGYDEAGTTYSQNEDYKAYESPSEIYGYHDNGNVDNGSVCGEKVDGVFCAWVFYSREKR